MQFPDISYYRHIGNIHSQDTVPLDRFFEAIREGDYQDLVIPIRDPRVDKAGRTVLKERLPSVTISGTFQSRFDRGLSVHSGFIGIDVDELGDNVEAFKEHLENDPYVVSAFMSVSGYGLCVVFQIEPDRHRDAFQAIAAYFMEKYGVAIDPTSINVSRARFISYDPGIYLSSQWQVFKKYLPKPPARKSIEPIFVADEFSQVVDRVIEKGVQVAESYRDWLALAFGLCKKLGEAGRGYFHRLSEISGKYDPAQCDKQYDVCLKHEDEWTGDTSYSLATFYWHAKNAGIDISSERTKMIAARTSVLKKNTNGNAASIAENLRKFDGIDPNESLKIIEQALAIGHDYHNDDENQIEALINWIKSTQPFKFNIVTRRMEYDGVAVDDMKENSIWIEAVKVFPKLPFDTFRRVLLSNTVPSYDPLREWFFQNQELPYNNEIMRLWSCIPVTDQGEFDDMVHFGTKWLVSVVASIFGDPSALVLVLIGEQHGTGKTEFFRRLLPKELHDRHNLSKTTYYAESKLDGNESDVAQLMCSKAIILDDEYGGQSKRELRKFKAMTSKDTFSVRKSYGRNADDLRRIAVLCGTCQELEILNDATGDQRRVIPVHVRGQINRAMNQIDRNALWAELYRMYKAGIEAEDESGWKILKDEIQHLNRNAAKFTEYSIEYELIKQYYELPQHGQIQGVNELTNGQIKTHIEMVSGQKVNERKLGQELKRLGFVQQLRRLDGSPSRVYAVVEKWVSAGRPLP